MKNGLLLAIAVVLAALGAVFFGRSGQHSPPSSTTGATARPSSSAVPTTTTSTLRQRDAFVGSAVCATCHQAQSDLHAGSHHARALTVPSAELAQSRFAASRFTSKHGGTTEFSARGGAPHVTTKAPDGTSTTLPIAYVSGVWPLEQYVVQAERGKLQSLGVVWDNRTSTAEGSRWFHVYGADGVAPGDRLFFTSPAQNWNHNCADCHSTLVERRYDVTQDTFDTRWAELSVGCEACHGPGAEHVRTARTGQPSPLSARRRASEPWFPNSTGSPVPHAPDDAEVTTCAPCHSRRTPLKEGFLASDPFLDFFEPELLWPGAYHADGQVEGEVYEWGSFLQSRMHQAGVRCSDCHNPHSGKPHAEGNALCARCHEPTRFDTSAHSHHTGPSAPLCIDCHMPPATFMQIDERRDHSIRIPRPDYSAEFGTPNACTTCHQQKSAAWAQATLARWSPAAQTRPHFARALAEERQGLPDAARALRALAADARAPAIARATALDRLGRHPGAKNLAALRAATTNADALVVYGAALGAAELPQAERKVLLVPLLTHHSRAVRVTAARALAEVPLRELSAAAQKALERAFVEVTASFDVNASQPASQVERSAFELARGHIDAARAALDAALRLEPCLIEAHLNRADLERARRNEAAAERAIRAALDCAPESAAAHHALGLWQVRARTSAAALDSLRKAVTLDPTDARFAYVLAVALTSAGAHEEAIRVLDASLLRHPDDVNALQVLARSLTQTGQDERATQIRHQLEQLMQQ